MQDLLWGDPGVRNADGGGHQNYLRNFFRIHTSLSPPFQHSWGGKKEKKVLVAQSCSTLCDPTEYSPRGSPDQGISQAIILEWVAISTSTGSSLPRDWTHISRITGRFFTTEPPGKPIHWNGYHQKPENTKCWQGCRENETLVRCWWDCKMMQSDGKQHRVSLKIKNRTIFRFSNSTLGNSSKTLKTRSWRDICTLRLITALFTNAKW